MNTNHTPHMSLILEVAFSICLLTLYACSSLYLDIEGRCGFWESILYSLPSQPCTRTCCAKRTIHFDCNWKQVLDYLVFPSLCTLISHLNQYFIRYAITIRCSAYLQMYLAQYYVSVKLYR